MELKITSTAALNDGHKIPYFGLGVYQSGAGSETYEAVTAALKAGYRHIDTAKIYGNERDVGAAVRESGIPREEIFVTTKLWNSDHDYSVALHACEESLKRLGFEYIDLYLIHWPGTNLRAEAWKALVELKKAGLCRSIGVSNYTIRHLEELLSQSETVPAVNQVEFSPFLYQKDLLEFCVRHKIKLEAYSPLTRGERFGDKAVMAAAKTHRKTPAQVLIRWALQHDVVVIPKSVHEKRIKENADVFDFKLTAEEMKSLDSLNEDFRTSWNPTTIP